MKGPLRFSLLLGLLALTGCGIMSLLPGPTPTRPPALGRTITLADHGSTLTMLVAQRFLLSLGDEFQWKVTPKDERVLGKVPDVLMVKGSQGLYEAKKKGRTALDAVGEPACRKAKPPCEAPSRSFHLEIIVE